MTLFRVIHDKNYTVINNTICRDSSLSFKAKGIWLYAFSRPDDWKFYLNDLVKQSKDKESAVNSGLKELENAGYLRRIRHRDEKGRLGPSEWTFLEIPSTDTFEPKRDFPILDNPILENQALLSTDSLPSIEKHQQQGKDSAAAIYPSLEKIPESEVSQTEKKRISSKYDEVTVNDAVARVTQQDFIPEVSLLKSLNAACKNAWKPEISKQQQQVDKRQIELLNVNLRAMVEVYERKGDVITFITKEVFDLSSADPKDVNKIFSKIDQLARKASTRRNSE